MVVHSEPPANGQVFVPQSLVGLHATSHLHEDAQLTLPHAALPLAHVADSAPVPLVMLPHAFEPLHVTVDEPEPVVMLPHAALPPLHTTLHAPPHVMSPHAPADVHVIVQLQPGGHVMLLPPLPVTLHWRVAKLHAVPGHTAGHTAASGGASGGRRGLSTRASWNVVVRTQ